MKPYIEFIGTLQNSGFRLAKVTTSILYSDSRHPKQEQGGLELLHRDGAVVEKHAAPHVARAGHEDPGLPKALT